MNDANVYVVPMPERGQVFVKKAEAESVLPFFKNTGKEAYSVGWKATFLGRQYGGVTQCYEEEIDEAVWKSIKTMNYAIAEMQHQYVKENNHDEG